MASQTLLVTPSVPFARVGAKLYLDIKAVDGLKQYAARWPGRVKCLMRLGDQSEIVFGQVYDPADLPFDVGVLEQSLDAHRADFDAAAVVLASGDNYPDLAIPALTTTPIVFIIENTLTTRMRILRLTQGMSVRTAKSMVWMALRERDRRHAFRQAAGLQANGTAAFERYRSLSPAPIQYFDTRMARAQQVTPAEVEKKVAHVLSAKPLRLAFSGRLAAIKGVDHLVPFAQALMRTGTPFTLDIYGDGPLRPSMQQAVDSAGLQSLVRLHGAVPFDEALVPALKQTVDLFVCCHRQGDPSCTYMETLGCGVPIVGYGNIAFRGITALGDVGRVVPMDDVAALAAAVVALDRERAALAGMIRAAARISADHSFENVVQQRIDHLRRVAHV